MPQAKERKIAVVGLGYVGLPIAVAFGKRQRVIGFDINKAKIAELQKGLDRTGEVSAADLKATDVQYTFQPSDLKAADFIIVAVPTPINEALQPDLTALRKSSELIGANLSPGSIVVFESTVYPGATEEVCQPILEQASGMKCGVDFKLGYSPERINPGDKEHTLEKIIKVVSAQDDASLEIVANTYELCRPVFGLDLTLRQSEVLAAKAVDFRLRRLRNAARGFSGLAAHGRTCGRARMPRASSPQTSSSMSSSRSMAGSSRRSSTSWQAWAAVVRSR